MFSLQHDRKFYFYVQLSYSKISYLRKNTHLPKDTAFGKWDIKIFPWNENIRKLTKKLSFLLFSQIFVRRKFPFSCSDKFSKTRNYLVQHVRNNQKIYLIRVVIFAFIKNWFDVYYNIMESYFFSIGQES